ncbi:DUF4123 domain-containing protein [Pseudomonas sp. R5(2019)]|uniref:DUF4123 domain-containing protein n=1 Tax=Pseudomonas sp. R5(2019) TaxID=2697566 RepID=UPI001411E875|nr:DUF4123 domain-containing protein [Pseudomonas sp. R5(2019)]NBA97359.1 hypothetical protein [Pseudomonas sp. R5(2019)]
MKSRPVVAFVEQYRTANDSIYLLIDPLAEYDNEYPLSVDALTNDLGESAVERVLRPDLAHLPEACPALIQLAAPGETPSSQYLTRSALYALDELTYNKRYICGWLLSEQPLATVAQHLTTHCRTVAPAGGENTVPWYEPLRLELLAATLGHPLEGILWPIHAWLCPSSWGSFALFHGAADRDFEKLPAQVHEVQRAAPLVNQLLGKWRLILQKPLSYAPWRWKGDTGLPPQAAVHAFRLIRDAYRHGLRDNNDVIALCLYRVLIHPLLPQHPDIQRDISRAIAGTEALHSRFETYNDADWMRISAALPSAGSYT